MSNPTDPTADDAVERSYIGKGVVATFLSGLFAILPIVITIAIVGWVAQFVLGIVGPDTKIGAALRSVGLRFVTDPLTAQLIGWAIVPVGIWMLGLLVRTRARGAIDRFLNFIIQRVPFIKGIYGTARQVIGMLERRDDGDLTGMSVVFCDFGQEHGAGFLCLLATPDLFQFEGRDYHIVYMPTSPIPMTGGIIFVPADSVQTVAMSVEQLLEIYFSLGVLAPQAVPSTHHKESE